MLRLLLERGASPTRLDTRLQTLLHFAVMDSNPKFLKGLLDMSAEVVAMSLCSLSFISAFSETRLRLRQACSSICAGNSLLAGDFHRLGDSHDPCRQIEFFGMHEDSARQGGTPLCRSEYD